MKYLTHSLKETQKLAEAFVTNLKPKNKAVVVGLYGNLGAGKTTFTQGLVKALDVGENIVSPTFVIEKVYELQNKQFTRVVHIDAYRLEKSEELLHLGWNELISNQGNLVLIEWPENVADIMPEHIRVSFQNLDDEGSREIEILTL